MQTLEHQSLIKRVLGDNYLTVRFAQIDLAETLETSRVRMSVHERDRQVEVEGEGVGMVDAVFTGLLARYGREYASLKTLTLAGFSVSAALDTKKAQHGVDSIGTVTIDVLNSENRKFSFQDASRSVTLSTARAVLAMVEYFINSERAFILLDKARRDAIERNREDLVSRYTAEMAELVESTSYTEVIEAIRKRM